MRNQGKMHHRQATESNLLGTRRRPGRHANPPGPCPDSMRICRQTVEHPYGTIKLWMGSAHFLMRTLTHVSTEMSLHVLAYNLKRIIKILGIKGLMEAIKTWVGHYGGQTNTMVTINQALRGGF